MYKLLNRTDFLDAENLKEDMEYYMSKYNFDGIELIKFTDNDNSNVKEYVKGYHMRFFPSWLELYTGDIDSLYEELKDKKYFKSLCGGEESKEELLDYYRKELETAGKLQVEYLVLHACNSKVTECLTYKFKHSDQEVLDATISLINELFDNEKHKFKLLLENLWWPGLKLTSREEAEYLFSRINYKNIGFMLDTGHMINNNRELKNSKEAVEYIKKNIENLGEYKNYIYGMHLNYSLSGAYVKKCIEENADLKMDIEEIMGKIYFHVNNIDYHDPFEDEGIVEIIESLPIKYLVYEFIARNGAELEDKIERQERALKKLTDADKKYTKEEQMKKVVAFPTRDGVTIEKHFGHSDKFVIYTIEDGAVKEKVTVDAPQRAHGASAAFLKEKGADVVVTGHIGSTVFDAVKNNGAEFFLGAEGSIEEAVKAYIAGTLTCKGKEFVHEYKEHTHCCHGKAE